MRHHLPLETRFLCGNKNGYIALISVLIISAIVVLIATSASLVSISESDMSLEENQAWETFYLATACAEEALQQIRDSTEFSGSRDFPLGSGTCSYTVTKLTEQNRIVTASGSLGNIMRKIKITLDKITPDINITSWQQVAD